MNLSVLSIGILCAVSQAPTSAERAFWFAWRGDLAEARREVESILATSPNDRGALVVSACVSLEAGRLDEVSRTAERLSSLTPTPVEAAVLQRLAERRKSHPTERMRDALAIAWKEAGRPDVSGESALAQLSKGVESGKALLPPIDAASRARLTLGERLALEPWNFGDLSVRTAAALRSADDAPGNPLFVNLEVLSLLAPSKDDSAELRAKKGRAARRVGAAVAAVDPQNGYLAVAAALAGESDEAPLDGATLVKLEDAAALPRFEYPRRTVRSEMVVSARRADAARGDLRAASAALGSPVDAVVTLWRRAEATSDPAIRTRVARVLQVAGDGFESSNVLLERNLAVTLQFSAALLSGDSDRISRARAKRESVRTWSEGLRVARARLGIWPLVSDWREWDAEDEVPYMERLRESR